MILITYGTRPEYIKIKPLIDEMVKEKIPFKTLFTGQHKDIVNNDSDFILEMKEFGDNRLDNIIQNCMNIPEKYFDGIKYILVQGDTTSVMGLSLSALHRKIKVIHLEAGLRSYDTENPYPEENNRKIVSTIADIHLCPTEINKNNLLKENISEDKIFVVGNTSLDNLLGLKSKITYSNKVLVTLHRRENHEIMDKWFNEINNIASKYKNIEFILPLHPNPNVQKHRDLLTNVKVINPLEHEELLNILIECKLVITDSGGLQEECSFLNKKCIVCRKVTERPESLGLTSFLVKHTYELSEIFYSHLNSYEDIIGECPYGDGHSSKKICNILKNL
jgi:UDP-N-acetylglucosamine 2-epimerase (non-hydrolysing)